MLSWISVAEQFIERQIALTILHDPM